MGPQGLLRTRAKASPAPDRRPPRPPRRHPPPLPPTPPTPPAPQVADGKMVRHRYTTKHVQLSRDGAHVLWDEGKKRVDLASVLRVSVGLETSTLKRLYTGSTAIDVRPYHWFSLHTPSRSYDFGAKDGDENETLLLWVLTLQQIVAPRLPPAAAAATALANAQRQWQKFDTLGKEWPCTSCTFVNGAHSPECGACGSPRPSVTLLPCLMPLLPALQALCLSLRARSFEGGADAHLLWFVVQALEGPLPTPFEWTMRAHPASPAEPRMLLCAEEGGFVTADHPHILELRSTVEGLRAQLAANGGLPNFDEPSALFVSPSSARSSARGSSADESPRTSDRSIPAGLSQREFEEALAAAASLEIDDAPPDAPPAVERNDVSFERFDAADVFRHCMSGAVDEVRRFLEAGGHADTVYKQAYGWDVGPDWLFTKPSDGTTVLNYVATWTDVIGDAAVQLVELLLRHGADLQRDDGLDQWFTPVHNATANGASRVVAAMLDFQPAAVKFTTGDGRTPVQVLALCDDADDRLATLAVLLRRASEELLAFREPFFGNTALHIAAKEGHTEVVIRLLEAGAPGGAKNDAGLTAIEVARAELADVELQPEAVVRRSRLANLVEVMEISAIAID